MACSSLDWDILGIYLTQKLFFFLMAFLILLLIFQNLFWTSQHISTSFRLYTSPDSPSNVVVARQRRRGRSSASKLSSDDDIQVSQSKPQCPCLRFTGTISGLQRLLFRNKTSFPIVIQYDLKIFALEERPKLQFPNTARTDDPTRRLRRQNPTRFLF